MSGLGPADAGFRVVGIGASAGGLESLERFFARVPADTGMAFVVLQHLSPDFKSLMDELLGRRTSMPVRLAEHEMLLEPDVVHLLPPMKEMIVQKGKLLLRDRDPRQGLALPIDHFFRSLAQDAGERAIGVILSGTGSDGSRGIQEIRRAGGVVFCESPDSAQFNGMPLSAIATGVVDQVRSPEEIASAIAMLASPALSSDTHGESALAGARSGGTGLEALLILLQDAYGIDFSYYKAGTVTRRIERRLSMNSMDLDTYVEVVRADPRELNALYEDLLIGVTRFFRDEPAFDALERTILPEIVDAASAEGDDAQIRVWIPGCATGQEAYSVAILLHECLLARKRRLNVKILATDVHKASLEVASAGVYSEEQLQGISADRVEQFFTRRGDGYQVTQRLRESVVFAPHNLLRDSPFTKLDLICCRNLLIYFHPHAQKTILTLFHFGLKTGGYLFLGPSETPGDLSDEFDTIDPQVKMYRKRRDIGLPADLRLPLARTAAMPSVSPVGRTSGVSANLLATYDRLLERFMPPSFLVDDRGQLVDSYGGVSTLLKVKTRRPSTQLLDMLDDDLRTVVAAALHRITREGERVVYHNVRVAGAPAGYSLVAEPVRDARGSTPHFLIAFTEDPQAPPSSRESSEVASVVSIVAAGAAVANHPLSGDRVQALRDELSYTKENLQTAVENLEATNEELQATNEELIASNEELQSTNEELHSVNEELYTVNAEYQKKNAELLQLNFDVEHLLNETDVATLFLDRDLRIRKFTRRMAEIFHLLPQDIGRPVRGFSHGLTRETLMQDVEKVLQEGTPYESQTWDLDRRCYFMRILPYRSRTADGGHDPDGVVLTLTDISALEQTREKLAQISAIVESSDDAIIGMAVDGTVTSWNQGARRLFGYDTDEMIGATLRQVLPEHQLQAFDTLIAEAGRGGPRGVRETTAVRKDRTAVPVSIMFSPVFDSDRKIIGVSAIARDITPLVAAKLEIESREERIRLLLDSTAEAIYGVDLNGECTFSNAACARILGYPSPSSLIGKNMHATVHHTRRDGSPYPPERSRIHEAMRNRGQAHVTDEVLWRADGTSFPAEYWSHPIFRGDDVIGAVVTFLDITERRKAEDEIQEGVRRREHFLAMLSHELRNPLAAILSATKLLDFEGWGNERLREAGCVVERQAKHMTRLLDDLLDVSRITHGRIVLRPEILDLRDSTRAAIESLAPLMQEHGTVLHVDLPDAPVPVYGDPARLQQIQANLLSNAARYSDPGTDVYLSVKAEADQAVVTVSDRGRGIEAALLPRIFDMFVQGPQTLARSEGGLGIGLTLLRSLVELHDGRVEVFSGGRGKGSTFIVRLPLTPEHVSRSGSGTRSEPRPVHSIVLVEDSPDARRMMQLLLEAQGRQVHIAENGLNGVELIERIVPDLAIVDLGLPLMSGYDVARRLRQNPLTRDVRLIAWSGYGQDTDVQAALEAGFDDHLTKPLDPDRLDEILARASESPAHQ